MLFAILINGTTAQFLFDLKIVHLYVIEVADSEYDTGLAIDVLFRN